jgi:hypothetical protein
MTSLVELMSSGNDQAAASGQAQAARVRTASIRAPAPAHEGDLDTISAAAQPPAGAPAVAVPGFPSPARAGRRIGTRDRPHGAEPATTAREPPAPLTA